MNHHEWLEQAEIYALGALDGEELALFEAHLASGCPLCEDHLRNTRETLTLVSRSLTPVEPPSIVKARVLEQIASEAKIEAHDRPRLRWLWRSVGGAFAAACLLIALIWSLFATRQELYRLRGQWAALHAEAAQKEEILQFLSDPQVRFVHLAGLPPSPGASARLLWNPSARKGILIATGLPRSAQGQSYELWAIADSEPVPAGVFTVGQEGPALLHLPSLPEEKSYNKFAITREPAGGAPKPTGPMLLLGSL